MNNLKLPLPPGARPTIPSMKNKWLVGNRPSPRRLLPSCQLLSFCPPLIALPSLLKGLVTDGEDRGERAKNVTYRPSSSRPLSLSKCKGYPSPHCLPSSHRSSPLL